MNHPFAFLLPVCFILIGCSESRELPTTVPAAGVVTVDGQPLGQATILFIGEAGVYNARGQTDDNGKFELRGFKEKSGVVPGNYKVEINHASVTPQMISGLSVELNRQGDANLKFDLKSK